MTGKSPSREATNLLSAHMFDPGTLSIPGSNLFILDCGRNLGKNGGEAAYILASPPNSPRFLPLPESGVARVVLYLGDQNLKNTICCRSLASGRTPLDAVGFMRRDLNSVVNPRWHLMNPRGVEPGDGVLTVGIMPMRMTWWAAGLLPRSDIEVNPPAVGTALRL